MDPTAPVLETSELERRYLGEPVPRRPWLTFAAALLCPGLGCAYLGRPLAGVVLNTALVVSWVAFLVAWMLLQFSPLIPFLVQVAGIALLHGMLAWDMASWARRRGEGYVPRDVNHPLIYLGVALFSFWLPLYSVFSTAFDRLLLVAPVTESTMYPTLVPGDHVVVDRWGPRIDPLRPGDVVAYRDPRHGRRRFARLVATSSQGVMVDEGQLYVDGEPCGQRRLTGSALDGVESISGAADSSQVIVQEVCGASAWVASMPRTASWGAPLASDGAPGAWVVHDDRSDLDDSRTFGRVPLAAIEGRVTWIAWSQAGEDSEGATLAGAARAVLQGWLSGGSSESIGELRFSRRIAVDLVQ